MYDLKSTGSPFKVPKFIGLKKIWEDTQSRQYDYSNSNEMKEQGLIII